MMSELEKCQNFVLWLRQVETVISLYQVYKHMNKLFVESGLRYPENAEMIQQMHDMTNLFGHAFMHLEIFPLECDDE